MFKFLETVKIKSVQKDKLNMDDSERKKYLAEVEKETLTVGIDIPNDLEVNGKNIPANDVIFQMSSDGNLPDDVNITISQLKQNLIKEKNDLVNKIESGDISSDTAEKYVEKISQIERVIDSLNPDDIGFGDKSDINKAKKTKKWRNFIDKIRDS